RARVRPARRRAGGADARPGGDTRSLVAEPVGLPAQRGRRPPRARLGTAAAPRGPGLGRRLLLRPLVRRRRDHPWLPAALHLLLDPADVRADVPPLPDPARDRGPAGARPARRGRRLL